ncbi:MAG TPA: hypothetical protein VMS02_05640 [Solirubrobacteraceae bacterium]|nr:hypothetical protein [Solirubrobacteraceae bacterium]
MKPEPQDIQTELASVVAHVRAPESLQRSVAALVQEAEVGNATRSSRRLRSRPLLPRLRLLAAGALGAAAILAALLALEGATTRAPTVSQVSHLALSAATRPAPGESAGNPRVLAAAVEGLHYPYWGTELGWQAVGARHDRLRGRAVTTVFYADRQARRVGYAIVAGGPLAVPRGSAVRWHGVVFHVLRSGGATIVTWRQDGHTCVLAARGVGSDTLLRLAGWSRS